MGNMKQAAAQEDKKKMKANSVGFLILPPHVC